MMLLLQLAKSLFGFLVRYMSCLSVCLSVCLSITESVLLDGNEWRYFYCSRVPVLLVVEGGRENKNGTMMLESYS